MNAGITTPLRIATSAVRRRAELEQATAGLRSAARCANAWKSAGVRFPPDVLGEALLGMMSAQFRKLLQSPDAKEEARSGRKPRRGIVSPAAREGAGTTWAPPGDEHRVSAGFAASGNARGARGFENVANANETRRQGIEGQLHLAAGMESEWEAAERSEAAAPGWPEASAPGGGSKLSEPTVALVEKLSEYWALERRDRKAHASALAEDRRPLNHPAADSAPEERPKAESPRFTGRADFASRLQAFVSGGAKSQGGDARWDAPEMRQATANQYLAPDCSAPGSRMPLAGDFAERLSQTLREQAMHHGIDLT